MQDAQRTTQYSSAWIMLLALLTSLGPLSIDMYLPALPQMAQDFGVSTQRIANTLPAYFLGLAAGQLIYGPVSDRIGRKAPLYFGLCLYIAASLICLFAQSEWSLIAARILQALGGCVGVVIARAAIRDRLDLQASAQAFSSMMIVMGIAPIIAPALGSLVLKFFSWHAVFACLSLMGVVCLLCVHFFFKETLPASRRLNLNFNQVQVILLLGADDDVVGSGAVQAVRQDGARLLHGLVSQRNRLAVVPNVRFHAQREGDAPGNINAVFQPLLEEGEQGKRRNADNENRSGIALDLVLVGTQVPEKHTQQYQTANENEERVVEEIVNKRERSGHSASRGESIGRCQEIHRHFNPDWV